MPHDAFIARIRHLGRVHDEAHADRLAEATLRALGPALPGEARAFLGDRLGPVQRAHLGATGGELDGALLALFGRVAALSGLPEPAVRDHLPAVFGALAEAVGERHLPTFRALAPEYLAPLFVLPSPDMGLRPPPYVHPARGKTLGAGRPGSSRPLCEASPSRGHAHSIARSDDPHGETRMASSRGLPSEREGRTLADGRPGSTRPIAGSR